jgi:xanthine dehydrogenase accessory factor
LHDLLHELRDAWRRGETSGLATVVRTFDSAPQPAGANMLVRRDGTVVGSVSGGCVEGAVYELAQEAVREGTPRLQRYGVSDEDAFEVGLTCGGTLDVFVEPIDASTLPGLEELVAGIDADEPVALATVIEHVDPQVVGRHLVVRAGATRGSTGLSTRADDAITDDARGLLAVGATDVLTYGPDGERRGEGMRIFVRSWAPKPHMVIFGAVDFAAALAQQGRLLGYRVTICDARPVFATEARFPGVDEVVVDWPHRWLAAQVAAGGIDRRTVLCVLTHDPKFDVPVLDIALRLTGGQAPAFVGAMGSRATHLDRHHRLRAAGLTHTQLERLSSPIGLDLGGRTPQETAVSIAAEIVAARWGGTGERLSQAAGRIHHASERS